MTEPEVKPTANTTAKMIATECQNLARVLGNHQDDQLTLKARDCTRLVSALSSAGNVLATLDQFDPSGPAPTGYEKKIGYDPEGNVTVTFTAKYKIVGQLVDSGAPVEGYDRTAPA